MEKCPYCTMKNELKWCSLLNDECLFVDPDLNRCAEMYKIFPNENRQEDIKETIPNIGIELECGGILEESEEGEVDYAI